MTYLKQNNGVLTVKTEREAIKKDRLVAVAVTAPLMIYAALDKKPPKILKALTLAVAIDLIIKNMRKLNVDNNEQRGENKAPPGT